MEKMLGGALIAAVVLCTGLLSGCVSSGPVPYPPLESSHPDLRARMLAHLGENLLPFWLENGVDHEYGGFLTVLNRNGSMRGGQKMIVTQSRQIWTFSRLWKNGYHDPRIREAAELGFDFFRRHFWDEEHEGWFWQVSRDGTPEDMSKRTYGHAFVIYAMVEYYRAFEDPAALTLAETTLDVLERHAKDLRHPGYIDFMDRRWQPDPDYNGHIKTMNTHLHLMEALTELYMVTGKPLHKERLREVLDILVEKCYMPEYQCCVDGFRYDWSRAQPEDGYFGEHNRLTSYGHNVEFGWLMQRAVQVLGLPEQPYRQMGLSMMEHAMKYGWHEEAGAMCYEGPWRGPATNRAIEWWVQAENAVALDWAHRLTGDDRYLAALRQQVTWILEKQSDRLYGGWYSTLRPDGKPRSDNKAGVWHAAYHDVRACLNVGLGRWE